MNMSPLSIVIAVVLACVVALLMSCGILAKDKTWKNMGDYRLCVPYDYNPATTAKKYPLFVYLHGANAKAGVDVLPCFISPKERETFPAFVYVPHTKGNWDNTKLIAQIEEIKGKYPIDVNRLYLMGYSMGGPGSYSLANDYFGRKGQLFAGIVRMAGQSQATLCDAIVKKTSVWYFVGLADTDLRVKIAQEAYSFLKGKNPDAVETTLPVSAETGHAGTTLTLRKNGIEIVKYTRFDSPVGHGINSFPLKDPAVLQWLFSQSLEKR
jgi:predicted peptidase